VKNPSGTGVTEVQADEKGFVVGTGVESQDLVAVSEKMARGILSLPAIQSAVTPPVIIMDPVVNDTRFPLNKDIFLTRIRVLLSTRAAGKATFVARDRMAALQKEQELKQTGQVSGTPETAFKGGDYLLTGTLQGLTTRTSRGTSDYVLYNFQLVDFHTSAIVWEDFAEIKKQGLEDAAYR
jgi:PBP1b-binding outer membrane lipoprotein LpoB